MHWLSTLLVSFIAGVGFTPIAAHIAIRVGLVDRPDGHRKLHGREVPLGGGLAILAAMGLTLAVSLFLIPNFGDALLASIYPTGSLIIAALLVCLLGLIDDRFEIRGRQKLLGQCVACLIAVLGGTVIQRFELFGYTWDLGLFAIPITCLWLLAVVNAMNLIDGADGLATTVGIVISLSLAATAHLRGHPMEALLALIVAGSLFGFLIYNKPPAKIFLGDAGSMLIGMLLGVLAIRSSLKGPTTVGLMAAVAIWAVLFFDVLMAITRRKLTGRSLYVVDRGHLHHTLLNNGFSPSKTMLLVGLACTICGVGALISVALKSEVWALISVLSVLGISVGTKTFGFHECELFARRLNSFVRSMFARVSRLDGIDRDDKGSAVCSRFQGDREWELLWNSLIDYAERFDLCKVQMNISSPSIKEEFHAVWHSRSEQIEHDSWRMELPLFFKTKKIGSLGMIGQPNLQESNLYWLSELIEGLRGFEVQLNELLAFDAEEVETREHTVEVITQALN